MYMYIRGRAAPPGVAFPPCPVDGDSLNSWGGANKQNVVRLDERFAASVGLAFFFVPKVGVVCCCLVNKQTCMALTHLLVYRVAAAATFSCLCRALEIQS